MEIKLGSKEKTIVLVILVILGIIINTLSPVSLNKTVSMKSSQPTVSQCKENNQDVLSALLNIGNEKQNDNSCLFIGCGSLF